MRKIPIDTVSAAIATKIRARIADFAVTPYFADLDEFWNLETTLTSLKLPCVIVEFVQCEPEVQGRDALMLPMVYRVNYLCGVPSGGKKRSSLLIGTRKLAEIFAREGDVDPFEAGLSVGESGIDQASVVLTGIQLNTTLSEKNVGWGVVTILVNILSYPGA